MENVYDWWMKSGNITSSTRVFEIGFGYGMLGYNIEKLNGSWVGINNNIDQVTYARTKLELKHATHGDWRDIPNDLGGKFDVVFVRGCIEHFVYHTEAVNNQSHALYTELLSNLTKMIDPNSSNQRIVMSMMRHRNPVDPEIFTKKYSEYPMFSDAYYLNIINRWWGGYYPSSLDEVLGSISTLNLTMIDYVDDTYDYYRTDKDWSDRMADGNFTYEFWKKAYQLIKTLFSRNQDLDEALMAYKTGAWRWQFTPRRDFQNFSDTPVINARWVLRTV
jgi:cyclopropane fatty-acyl-phospholipid synthase-like methyltransferase